MADLRNSPTQERSRQTLDAIMAAANELFCAKGVDASTNTEIAEVAEVSIGSLYRFFPNKEALVVEYVDRYINALAAEFPPLPEHPDVDDLEQIVDLLIERSATVRRTFIGFSEVRRWRSPDSGERPAKIVADAELAMVTALFESSIYDLDPSHVQRMSLVIQVSVYPVLEMLPDLSKAKGNLLLAEVKKMLCAYIRDSVDTTKLADAG